MRNEFILTSYCTYVIMFVLIITHKASLSTKKFIADTGAFFIASVDNVMLYFKYKEDYVA